MVYPGKDSQQLFNVYELAVDAGCNAKIARAAENLINSSIRNSGVTAYNISDESVDVQDEYLIEYTAQLDIAEGDAVIELTLLYTFNTSTFVYTVHVFETDGGEEHFKMTKTDGFLPPLPTPEPTPIPPDAGDIVGLYLATDDFGNESTALRYGGNGIDAEFAQSVTLEAPMQFIGKGGLKQIPGTPYVYAVTHGEGNDQYLTFFNASLTDGIAGQTHILVQENGYMTAGACVIDGTPCVVTASKSNVGGGIVPLYLKAFTFDGEDAAQMGTTFETTQDFDAGPLLNTLFQSDEHVVLVTDVNLPVKHVELRAFAWTGTTFADTGDSVEFNTERVFGGGNVSIHAGRVAIQSIDEDYNTISHTFYSYFGSFNVDFTLETSALNPLYSSSQLAGYDPLTDEYYFSSNVNYEAYYTDVVHIDLDEGTFTILSAFTNDYDTGEPYPPALPFNRLGMTTAYNLEGDPLNRLVQFDGSGIVTVGVTLPPPYTYWATGTAFIPPSPL